MGVATPLRGACQSCTSRQDTVIVRSAVGCHLRDSSAFATVNRIRPQDSLGRAAAFYVVDSTGKIDDFLFGDPRYVIGVEYICV